MLLLEQSAIASSSPFVPQCGALSQASHHQPYSCDFLENDTELASFAGEDDLKISTQTALEFFANESVLLEMFQVCKA